MHMHIKNSNYNNLQLESKLKCARLWPCIILHNIIQCHVLIPMHMTDPLTINIVMYKYVYVCAYIIVHVYMCYIVHMYSYSIRMKYIYVYIYIYPTHTAVV